MAAVSDQTTVVEDQDAIGSRRRRQVDGRPESPAVPAAAIGRSPFSRASAASASREGRRLIQDQDRRPANQRSRDRQPLTLAARQGASSFRKLAVQAARQRLDEIEGADALLSVSQRNASSDMRAAGEIVPDRPREQHRLLIDHAHPPAEPPWIIMAEIMPTDLDPAPDSSRSWPSRMRTNVDLPEPLRPTIATSPLPGNVAETSFQRRPRAAGIGVAQAVERDAATPELAHGRRDRGFLPRLG